MLKIDHIVHFLERDSSCAAEAFSNEGIRVAAGGSHERWGTKNSLCYSSDGTYIEWLSVENHDIAAACDNPLIRQQLSDLKKGEGFGQICLRTDDIGQLAEALTEKGFSCHIFDGQRKRTDGTILEWKMLFLEEDFGHQIPYPFFIQWGKSDELRLQELRDSGLLNGFSIKRITYLVEDAEAAARKWAPILEGMEIKQYKDEKEELEGLQAKIGSGFVFFAETTDPKKAILIKERGERPVAVALTGLEKSGNLVVRGGSYQLSGN